jgi:hypothetical protein
LRTGPNGIGHWWIVGRRASGDGAGAVVVAAGVVVVLGTWDATLAGAGTEAPTLTAGAWPAQPAAESPNTVQTISALGLTGGSLAS